MKRLATLIVMLTGLLPATALAGSYQFTTIDPPGSRFTQATGINNSGQITGTFYNGSDNLGFTYNGTSYSTFTMPGVQPYSGTEGINDSGQVVGYYYDSSYNYHGFLMDGSSYTTIDDPGSNVTYTVAHGINASGLVVGTSIDDSGVHGFSFNGATYTQILYPGSTYTDLSGVNNSGSYVGDYQDSLGNSHSFDHDASGFHSFDAPNGFQYINASGINDAGVIVGSLTSDSVTYEGYVLNGSTFTYINVPGSLSTTVTGINDAGQLVGFYEDSDRHSHGFVATATAAVPEPTSLTMLATAALGVAGWSRRQSKFGATNRPSRNGVAPAR